jgi:hypothetical protein
VKMKKLLGMKGNPVENSGPPLAERSHSSEGIHLTQTESRFGNYGMFHVERKEEFREPLFHVEQIATTLPKIGVRAARFDDQSWAEVTGRAI